MISLPITKCWPQYSCCNMLPLTCISCLIIGLGTELTASTVKRWFTPSSSFQRWTCSAANFLPSTQKKRKKKKDVFCFLVTEKRKHKVNFVFLWKSILHCEIKRCLDETREKREHTHPCIKWQQAEVNQVNAKTLNRTNHSVLPVHLFTFSIDLIHTHIPSSHPTLRMNHEEKGPWVELIPNTHTHTCPRDYHDPTAPCLINWTQEDGVEKKEKTIKVKLEYKTEVRLKIVSLAITKAWTVMVQYDYHTGGPYRKRKRTHGKSLQGKVITV